jgi:thiol-disulfide isomerase/thioredoxin
LIVARLSAIAFALLAGCAPGRNSGSGEARAVDLAAIREAIAAAKGRPLVVNHWATWCAPCVEELPAFAKSARAHAGKVRFLGVSWDGFTGQGSAEEIRAAVEGAAGKAGLPYPTLVFFGAGEDLFEGLGLEARTVPQTFVFDAAGKPVARFEEQVEPAALEEAIRKAGA